MLAIGPVQRYHVLGEKASGKCGAYLKSEGIIGKKTQVKSGNEFKREKRRDVYWKLGLECNGKKKEKKN